MKKARILKILACFVLCLCLTLPLLVACNPDQGGKDDAKITLNPTSVSVAAGETKSVQATLSGITGNVTWSSSNNDVATVAVTNAAVTTKAATITGVAEGTATITATAGGKSATCAVTVTAASSHGINIKLNGAVITVLDIDKGDTATLTTDATGVTWTSNHNDIVSVDNGVITAVAAGEATIKASVSATEYAEVTVTVYELVNIPYDAGEPAGWSYWNGDSDAVVVEHYYKSVAKEAHIVYNASYGVAWGLQLKYNSKYSNKTHNVALVIDSPAAGSVTVNDTNVVLTQGANTVTRENVSGRALYVGFGSEDNRTELGNSWTDLFQKGTETDLHFVIKEVEITADGVELAAPSFTYDNTAKTVAITDTANSSENLGGYQLGFFAEGDVLAPSYTVAVTNGNVVDFSTVASGTYTVKLRAVGKDATVIDSDWSENSVEITVTNDKTPITTSSTDGWYYWAGEGGAVGDAYLDADGAIHIKDMVAGSKPYSVQFKLNLTSAVSSITMTIHCDVDGYIAFGPESGSVAEREVKAGDTQITITGVNITGTLVICFANNQSNWSGAPLGHLSGDIILSNIVLA